MSAVTDDTLLQIDRPCRLHQHLDIVIAFKDIIVRIAYVFLNLIFNISRICHIYHFLILGLDDIAYGAFTIMTHRQYGYSKILQFKAIVGAYAVQMAGRDILCRICWYGVKQLHLCDMVAVCMRNQKCIALHGIIADLFKAAFQIFSRCSTVNDQFGILMFYQTAVTFGTAGQ